MSENDVKSLKRAFKDTDEEIMGFYVPILKDERIKSYYEFLQNSCERLESYNLVRVRMSIQMRAMVVKVVKYPYFLVEIDHMMLINSKNAYYSKFPTMNRMITKTIAQIED